MTEKSLIQKKDENYAEYVEVHDTKHYDILANKLNNGESVVCPHDPDMFISKTSKGEIYISKRTFTSNPFKKQ